MSYVRNADGCNEGSSRRGGKMWADLKATLKSCQLLVMNWLWANKRKIKVSIALCKWHSQNTFLSVGCDSLSRAIPTKLSHTSLASTWFGHSVQNNCGREAWEWAVWAGSTLEVKATWGCPSSRGCGQGQFSIEVSGGPSLEWNELSSLLAWLLTYKSSHPPHFTDCGMAIAMVT